MTALLSPSVEDIPHGVVMALAAGLEPRLERVADPLLATVLHADAAARRGVASVPELLALHRRVAAGKPDEPVLRWLVAAAIGDRCLVEPDVRGAAVAVGTLAEVPDDPWVAPVVGWVRGRLHRLAATLALADPAFDRDEVIRLRDAAVADFIRAGLTREIALTDAVVAALQATWRGDDPAARLVELLAARRRLGAGPTSAWLPLVDSLVATVELVASFRHAHRSRDPVAGTIADLGLVVPARRQAEAAPGRPAVALLTELEDRAHGPALPTALRLAADEAVPHVRVRVMAPRLDIEVDGRPVVLRTSAARLLLALVVAHPRSVHVGDVTEALWPGLEPGRARGRLNAAVHHLRRTLGRADLVERAGDTLALRVDRAVDVDLVRLRRPTVPRPLMAITGMLCDAQFPRDENLAEARRAVAVELAERAGRRP